MMDEFQAWQRILSEWQKVIRVRRLNQELYDTLGGALTYILNYAKQNSITLPNQQRLWDMVENLHTIIDAANNIPTSNEQPNRNNRRRNTTNE